MDRVGSKVIGMARTMMTASVLALALGCSGGDDPDPGTGGAAGATAGPCDGRGDTFAQAMSKSDGNITVSIVDADPAPPARYSNTWMIEVRDADGPLTGADVSAAPDMPDHGHGAQAVQVTPQTDGKFELKPLNLFMPGYWEIPITVTLQDQSQASVTFGFCIEG